MKLDQFIKWKGLASTGGEAKHLITAGNVLVNGSIELRRGRKLSNGDIVCLGNIKLMFGENDTQGRKLAIDDQ